MTAAHDEVAIDEFRAAFRQWLADHLPTEPAPPGGPERARYWGDWHKALYGGGWMGLSWPVEYGGRGLPPVFEAVFNDEIGRAGGPPAPHVGFLGRALLHFGSEEQKRRYLPGLLSGDEVWCQGFSEPGAGSDLAAIATRAEPVELDPPLDGESQGYLVNGQKVWTSDAAWADRCLLLARTGPPGERHRGLSALVVDMGAPGVEVRPITQVNGDTEFNEVFLTDVAVPGSRVIGEPGQGWAIAMTTVGYERGPADVGFSSRYARLLADVVAAARSRPVTRREQLAIARAHVQVEVLRAHVWQSLRRRDADTPPGPEGSIDKLLGTRTEQLLHHVALDIDGGAPLRGDAPAVLSDYLYSRAGSIAGGTSEIQRGIVAERVLGMPRAR
jgi:alkylation response protein AidB-like acyl-CoA dehydrogenase